MITLRRKHLAGLVAVLVIGAGALERPLWRMLESAYAADDVIHEGFFPALCAGDLPPAELLALADWPLDEDGIGCRPHAGAIEAPGAAAAKSAPAAASVAASQEPAPVAVEERTWRPVRPLQAADAAPQGRRAAAPRAPEQPSRQRPEPILFAGALVDDATLDSLRGGFETPGGLVVSFGIERLVYVNGALSSMTRLNVADLGQLAGRGIDPAELPSVGSTLALIQNGPNNTFVAQNLASGAFATVIQNSLDNQLIQSVTTINATVNSLEMMRANRLGESLRSAVSGSMIR